MRITNYGFVEVGKWEPSRDLKNEIDFKLHRFEKERVIYAFVVNGEEKYVGACEVSETTLRRRMSTQRQNTRIARLIRTCLEQGKVVKIFALKPEPSIQYKGIDVDLVKGLENPLINILGTYKEWNKHR